MCGMACRQSNTEAEHLEDLEDEFDWNIYEEPLVCMRQPGLLNNIYIKVNPATLEVRFCAIFTSSIHKASEQERDASEGQQNRFSVLA